MTSFRSAVALILCAGSVLSVAGHARAQVINWNNPAGGLWTVAANWNPQSVPDTVAESALIALPGVYTVTFNASANIGGLAIPNADATVAIANAVTMGYAGAQMALDGRLIINAAQGGSVTQLRFDAASTVLGPGRLTLNASANIDTALLTSFGPQVTLAPGATIDGTGRISAPLLNTGLINANVNGRALRFDGGAKTNQGVIRATAGGLFEVIGIPVAQGPAGLIEADGGAVSLSSAPIAGGTLRGVNPSAVSITGTCLFSGGVRVEGNLGVNNASALAVGSGGLSNAGVLTVNAQAGGSFTTARFEASGPLGGGGQLVLNASANIDTAVLSALSNVTIDHAAGHTIRGTGRVSAGLINNGLLTADVAGRTLRLDTGAKSNNALMSATGGGALELSGIAVAQDNDSGRILAAGGSVSLTNTSVVAGRIESANPASPVTFTGTCTLTGVRAIGPALGLANASTLVVRGSGLRNDGTLTINTLSGGSFTSVRFAESGELSGTGRLVLNASANFDTAFIQTEAIATITHAAPHLIQGTGRISAALVNNSEIRADRDQRTLELLGSAKTNNGLLLATGGGTLSLANFTLTQNDATGLIRADGGTVSVLGVAINGGRIESANDQSSVTYSGNNTLAGVRTTGPAHAVPNGSTLTIADAGLVNDGVITINPAQGGSLTALRFSQNAPLSGAGQLVLNASLNIDTAFVQTNNNVTITHDAPHLIRGTGRISAALINNSEIRADRDQRRLDLLGNAKTNNALLRATGGGTLSLSGFTLSQNNATGRVLADGGAVAIVGASISGGSIESANAQSPVEFSGVSTLSNVRLSGPALGVANGQTLAVRDGLTNDATLTINSVAGGSGTTLRVDTPGAVISGSGTIRLNANVNPDTAFISLSVPSTTLGPAQTLAGRGRLNNGFYDIQGTLSPGFGATPIDTLAFSNAAPRFAPSSVLAVDVAGAAAGQFDRVTTTARQAVLGGVVRVARLNGFVATDCVSLPILTTPAGNTGQFLRVEGDTGNPNRKWRLFNSGTEVLLTSACIADFNADCDIDFNDVLAYLNLYNAQDPEADLDGDGAIDFNDFLAFLNVYTSAC